MTSEQIEKLKSLGDLLNNGTITKDEFNLLKAEVLNENAKTEEKEVIEEIGIKENGGQRNDFETPQHTLSKQKIRLVGFQNITTQKLISPPKIEYLDINDISVEDEKQLKAFLRLKQIFSPASMTEDEIKIGNKLFTLLEIEEINSERPGLNYPWAVITSVIAAGASLYLMYISPCFGFLGAGTGMASAALMSLYVLTRVSATKMDKILSVIAIILSIGAFIAYQSHFE